MSGGVTVEFDPAREVMFLADRVTRLEAAVAMLTEIVRLKGGEQEQNVATNLSTGLSTNIASVNGAHLKLVE